MAGLIGPATAGSVPGELKGNATLIWGSKTAPKNKDLKPVSPTLAKKLRKTLKWEHYYQISEKDFALSQLKAKRVAMSKKCVLELQQLKSNELRVKMIGQGKVVLNKKHPMKNKDALVLGGPDKDKSAWFVVIQFN